MPLSRSRGESPLRSAGVPSSTARLAEQRPDERERGYRDFFEGAVEGMYRMSPEGRCLAANPAMARLLGYDSPAEFVSAISDSGRQLWADPDERSRFVQLLEERGSAAGHEYRMKRKDGTLVWIRLSSRKVCGAGGRTLCYEGFMEDISERKLAEEAHRKAEERFAATFRFIPTAVALTEFDDGFTCIDVNGSFEEIVGYGRDELVGRSMIDFGLFTDADEVAEGVRRLRADGRLHDFEFTFRRKDGCLRTGLISLTPIELEGRTCALSATVDITDRRRAEQAVRERNHQLLTIAQCLPGTLWTMDLSGRFTYLSPHVLQTHGWTPEELVNQPFSVTVTPEQAIRSQQRLEEELTRAASPDYDRNSVLTLESQELRKDGTPFWAEVSAGLLWSDDGRPVGLIGATRDITERKRVEEEGERLRAELLHSHKMESIGRLAGGIAHDFNNSMGVILLQADSALQELDAEDPVADSVRDIQDSAQRAILLARQLLAFSRKQVLLFEVLDLNSVIAECEKLVRRVIGEDIELAIRQAPGLGLVRADRSQVDQIIMNLAVNSRDAMPDGGTLTIATANVEIDESETQPDAEAKPGWYVVLTVTDTGVGMDQATEARAFEPFFTTKEVGRGTGLGLSVVYGIVKQSMGFIRVRTEPGQGTEFKIYLPRVLEAPTRVLGPERDLVYRGDERILLAEDEPALREKVREILESAGYSVLTAGDGEEALRVGLHDTGPLNLLLTDVVMPRMSGPGLLARLQPVRPGMKVLYMSGYPTAAEAVSLSKQQSSYIQKPFTQGELLRRVREILDGAGE